MSNSNGGVYLPQEIITEILVLLPVKSIGRCRCVSKAWRLLLTAPQFIKSHLNLHLSSSSQTMLLHGSRSLFTATSLDRTGIFSGSMIKNFDFLSNNTSKIEFGGSCDGLVLVSLKEKLCEELNEFLINPTTLEYVKLPPPPPALSRTAPFTYGFGYDNWSDDYKIVALSHLQPREGVIWYSSTFVEVYSVKKNSWKTLGFSPHLDFDRNVPCGVALNGCLHWIGASDISSFVNSAGTRVYAENLVIAAFSLHFDKFENIPFPKYCKATDQKLAKRLFLIKECLGIMVYRGLDEEIDLWTMNEYGYQKSWTKITIDAREEGIFTTNRCLCFPREGLFCFCPSLDGTNGYLVDDTANGDHNYVAEGGITFTESLASPRLITSED